MRRTHNRIIRFRAEGSSVLSPTSWENVSDIVLGGVWGGALDAL